MVSIIAITTKIEDGKVGRPLKNLRKIVNGILWICRTGAPWIDLPDRYVLYQTCYRYFQKWSESGLWNKILWHLAKDLKEPG